MSDTPGPRSKKKALLIAVRHVQSKSEETEGLPELRLAHRDARDLRDRLIGSHGYDEEDVVLMMDDKYHPEYLWPTHKRILRQIDRLIGNAQEDGHFFFYYSGHGVEKKCLDHHKADGNDGEIVSADGVPIIDVILHHRLITPLEKVKGTKLFALFDCCHSESLLDLQVGNGPNVYSRDWPVGIGQVFKSVAMTVAHFVRMSRRLGYYPSDACPSRSTSTSIPEGVGALTSPVVESDTIEREESTDADPKKLHVICLSACRDRQIAHDDSLRKVTFTKCFMDALSTRPDMTWVELRDELKTRVLGIQTCWKESLRGALDGTDAEGEHVKIWMQEPRYSTTPHTDLTKRVEI